MKGIYIHIPFCRKICNYCDFYKMVVSDKFKSEYVDYLIKDLELTFEKNNIEKIDTIYIGGGTPSSLPLNLLEKLFQTLLRKVELSKLEEFTIEANPEDLTNEFIILLKKYFVSRVSIGVQTFDNRNYPILGRYTDFETLKEKIQLLKEIGINNYNLDLIYAIPNTSLANLESDLDLPNIEAVFTTDEEIGMIGAGKLDASLLKSKKMINLYEKEKNEAEIL